MTDGSDKPISQSVVWIGIFIVCGVLAGSGGEAINDVLEHQGVSPLAAAWLMGIALVTLPVAVCVAVVVGVVRSTWPVAGKWAGAAAAVYVAGVAAAILVENTTALQLDGLTVCRGGLQSLIPCYLGRGLVLFAQSYTWQFVVAGLLIYGGVSYTFWDGISKVRRLVEPD